MAKSSLSISALNLQFGKVVASGILYTYISWRLRWYKGGQSMKNIASLSPPPPTGLAHVSAAGNLMIKEEGQNIAVPQQLFGYPINFTLQNTRFQFTTISINRV